MKLHKKMCMQRLTGAELKEIDARIKANADTLIEMGVSVWLKTRRKKKRTKLLTKEDQQTILRKLEEGRLQEQLHGP